MFNYNFETNSLEFMNSPILWVDFSISLILLGLMVFLFSRIFKSKIAIISEIVLFTLTMLSWLFGMQFLWMICLCVLTAVIVIFFLQNTQEIKTAFAGLFMSKKKVVVERIYDREEVAKKITSAVEILSKTKTGALITFERGDKFDDIVKSGTLINSPICPELLLTIFYPGTRLHDGAVVIRRDEILAASVYYTPTTRPLTGKYGSRHRAAIGISEKTDAITLIVSEETGRISIAYKGDLIQVLPEKIEETLLGYLMQE